jgi:hypothetical protein
MAGDAAAMRTPRGRIIASACAYGLLITLVALALPFFEQDIDIFPGFGLGAASLVALFAGLADVRFVPRCATAAGLLAYTLALLVTPLLTVDFVDQSDLGWYLLMWATGFSVVIGLLLPIRAYVGTLGQPRLGPRRAPSLIDLLGITGYFALVPFPLLGAIGQGFAPVAIIYGGIMFGACAGPALALLGNSMRARAAGVVLGLGVLGITAGFIYLVANQAGLTLVLAMLSGVAAPLAPLLGVVILRLNGYRLRR